MILIQIVLIFFLIFACFNTINRYRKGHLALSQFLMWLLFWLGAAVVVIDPKVSVFFAQFLGVGRGADLIIYFALLFLFYMFFSMQIKIEKIEREITKIVRDIALKDKK